MKKGLLVLVSVVALLSCSEEEVGYEPTPFQLNIPQILSDNLISPILPSSNPLTEEGVLLGKQLFFDTILSDDGSMACASCHLPQNAFTDNREQSVGIEGLSGPRNAMPIFNMAWNLNERFNWDGKALSLEEQAIEPVENPLELNSNWDEVIERLQNHPEYPELFRLAFNSTTITVEKNN